MNNKKVCDSWFATQQIDAGLYLITEPYYYSYNRANLWLIKGRDQDLLIDTGLGVASLRQHIAGLIDIGLWTKSRLKRNEYYLKKG